MTRGLPQAGQRSGRRCGGAIWRRQSRHRAEDCEDVDEAGMAGG
ncbi:hypothetical protein JL2886_01973 [Phaeobacter gallaeciensis]|uniref:Uncharacterized protein n=1 Tax=Phaeobacter gallaeciensis TaxID=60890 RepID=A0A1B0ZS34_9RHOB|nr:hypothetical protein JL2886_01973 [Phaeobacter gallaeciensis]